MSANQIILGSLLLLVACACCYFLLKRYAAIKVRIAALEREKKSIIKVEERILDFIHELGLSIDRERPPHTIHKIIVEGAQKVTQATGSALYLFGKTQEYLHPAAVSTHCPPLIPLSPQGSPQAVDSQFRLAKVNRNEGLVGYVLRQGRALCVENMSQHPAFEEGLGHYELNTSALFSPLLHDGQQIGVLVVARNEELPPFEEEDLYTFSAITEQSAFAIGNIYAHREAAEKRRLDSELQTAQEVQRVLLPSDDPRVPGYRIYGKNLPARMISGDYYDYLPVSQKTSGVMIADVSGKGVPAGIIMATFRSCLKALSRTADGPAQSLTLANAQIYPDIQEDMFISGVYTHLEHETGKLTLARAGHNPPYFYTALDDTIQKLKPPGLAVGIDEGEVFGRVIKDHEITMQSGDCLLLYTDGIQEATNLEGEEFGTKRLEDCFRQSVHGGAEILVKSILKKLQLYSKGTPQADDITLVAIEKE